MKKVEFTLTLKAMVAEDNFFAPGAEDSHLLAGSTESADFGGV
jgi:hypothetical protein